MLDFGRAGKLKIFSAAPCAELNSVPRATVNADILTLLKGLRLRLEHKKVTSNRQIAKKFILNEFTDANHILTNRKNPAWLLEV